MKIYLACTVRGDRGGVVAGRAICERLQRHGHEVLTTHLLADNVETAESRLTERDVFRRDLAWLTACDVLVAEASGSSYGVGDTARRDKVSRLITGNDDGACATFGYASIEELIGFIDQRFAGT